MLASRTSFVPGAAALLFAAALAAAAPAAAQTWPPGITSNLYAANGHTYRVTYYGTYASSSTTDPCYANLSMSVQGDVFSVVFGTVNTTGYSLDSGDPPIARSAEYSGVVQAVDPSTVGGTGDR